MEEEKISFWKTPEGKILSYGIHEHNSGLGYIVNSLALIKKMIENGIIEVKAIGENEAVAKHYMEVFNRQLEMILKGKKKCKDSMDYVYEQIKKLKGY